MSVQDTGQGAASDTQYGRRFGHAEPEWFQAVVLDAETRVGRVVHAHDAGLLLAIADQVDVVGAAILEPEHDSPVGRDRYAPQPLQLASQSMQPVARKVEVLDNPSRVEVRKSDRDPLRLLRLDLAEVSTLVGSSSPDDEQSGSCPDAWSI